MVAMEDDGIEPQIAGFAQDLLSQYSLLRGAPLRVALRGRGRIFENSEGRAETYELSSQVDHIDSFLSHTWGTPRWQKFMALSLHFGFPIAYASSLLVGCVISTLGALRVLCFVELESTDGLHRVPSSPFGACLCPLVFWLVLFLHSDLMPRLPGREHQIFLDKVCIHQTDAHLTQAGIAHLGMFLLFSGELVVLQANDYLERLWTVYELATFLVFHPEGRLVILPLNLPGVVLVSSAAFTMFGLVGFTFRTALVNEAVPFAAIYSSISAILIRVPFVVFAVFMMRRWATEEETRANHLQHHFSIGSARCANEDDRAPVMANIVTMLQTDDDDGTVNVFDSLVREAVPEAVRRSVGCSGLPYTDLLIIGTTLMGEGFRFHWVGDCRRQHISRSFPSVLVLVCVALCGMSSLHGNNNSVGTSLSPVARLPSQRVPRCCGGDCAARRLVCAKLVGKLARNGSE